MAFVVTREVEAYGGDALLFERLRHSGRNGREFHAAKFMYYYDHLRVVSRNVVKAGNVLAVFAFDKFFLHLIKHLCF